MAATSHGRPAHEPSMMVCVWLRADPRADAADLRGSSDRLAADVRARQPRAGPLT